MTEGTSFLRWMFRRSTVLVRSNQNHLSREQSESEEETMKEREG